jgi:hypothetical protein
MMRGGVIALTIALALLVAGCGQSSSTDALHFEGANGLLIDEHSKARDGWQMTSGSLFVDGGRGWTGDPNRGEPDGAPHGTTNSAVFRLRSTAGDLENVSISVRFRVVRLVDTSPEPFDGVHLWLHYRNPDDLYALTVMRRDGASLIKRKSGSDYRTLATSTGVGLDHQWHRARATAANTASGVRLRLWVDGRLVVSALDRDHPLTRGRVGVRTDDAEVLFDDLVVTTNE